MTEKLEKLYYLLTEAITNADGTNKPKNEHVSICYTDLQTYITKQEKKDQLLGLYRNQNYHWLQGNMAVVYRIQEKIKALEEELK